MGLPPAGRLFDSEQKARDAVTELVACQLAEDSITFFPAGDVGASSIDEIAEAIVSRHHGWVPSNHAQVWAMQIRAGKTLVLVSPPYGGERQVAATDTDNEMPTITEG